MLQKAIRKAFAVGLCAFGASLFTFSAQAGPMLPGLPNLNFLSYTGNAPKDTFTNVNPTGWTGGSGLIFIDSPGTASNPSSACGSTYLTTYGCPGTLAIAGGYNYVEADGNPMFESGFNFSISGLTVGTTYTLSFYQAASQQTTYNGDTTEQWIVSLGTSGLADSAIGNTGFDMYYNPDPNASIVATTLMNTPSHGLVDWNFVSVNLTADATTDLLSFLAWGDNGNTTNLPPVLFLTGVNSASGLNSPEPGSIVLFLGGFLCLVAVVKRRRKVAA